ncbi:MAG: hypothetical protein P8I51_04380 [Polaribacter sp.]|nr:hypothetical protein [Polaribacter sp.]
MVQNNVESYKGSALNYIRKYIIPSLPLKETSIQFTKSINIFIKNNKFRYIRKLRGYINRGNIYVDGPLSFTVTDNEPALWSYMECFELKVNSFEYYHKNSIFPIAFAITEEERKGFDSKFRYGKQKREVNFSRAKLKHCHIIDCSPRGLSLKDLNLDSRMLRLMSPMNHFPFPSPRHYDMINGDIGESKKFLNLVKQTLYNEYYKSTEEKKYFLNFLKDCCDKGKTIQHKVEDFTIEFSLKGSSDQKQTKKSAESESKNKQKEEGGSIPNRNSANFKVSQNWYGQGRIVKVQFNRGNYQDCVFIYDHDEVYNHTIDYLKGLGCWENYSYYSNSRNIPGWAKNYVVKTE